MNDIKTAIQQNGDWFDVELELVRNLRAVKNAVTAKREIAARILSRRLVWWATRARQLREKHESV